MPECLFGGVGRAAAALAGDAGPSLGARTAATMLARITWASEAHALAADPKLRADLRMLLGR